PRSCSIVAGSCIRAPSAVQLTGIGPTCRPSGRLHRQCPPLRPAVPRMKPRVSVVIPTYNRKSVLLESIASVQNQTVRELEILVCDDGSTDGSSDAVGLLMQRDARIRWIPGEHSGYPGISRNRGIRAAAGEWIAFQDSDDLWLPQKLERQLRIPDSISDARFIYSYAVTQFPDGSRKRMTPFR